MTTRAPSCYYVAYSSQGKERILWDIRFTLDAAKEYVDERNTSSEADTRCWVVQAENPTTSPIRIYP